MGMRDYRPFAAATPTELVGAPRKQNSVQIYL